MHSNMQSDQTNFLLSFSASVETAARHARQIPHLVSVFRGGPVLYQHPVAPRLSSVARGKEQDHYRYL